MITLILCVHFFFYSLVTFVSSATFIGLSKISHIYFSGFGVLFNLIRVFQGILFLSIFFLLTYCVLFSQLRKDTIPVD